MVQRLNANDLQRLQILSWTPVPFLDGKKIRSWYNPTALAFLGDSIWEVRTSHFSTHRPVLQDALAPCMRSSHFCDVSLHRHVSLQAETTLFGVSKAYSDEMLLKKLVRACSSMCGDTTSFLPAASLTTMRLSHHKFELRHR